MTFPNATRGPSLYLVAAVALALAGCNTASPPASTVGTGGPIALPAPDIHNHDVVLGTFEGSFDGENFMIQPVSANGSDVAGTRASVDTLDTIDAATFGSSATVSGTTFVALKQNNIAMRAPMGSGPAWDPTNCGTAPTSGTCVTIQMFDQLPDFELQHPYVQFTDITAVNVDGGTTPTVTLRSIGASDADYGVSNSVGLVRYPDRLARNGGSASPASSPFPGAFWVFSSTTSTIQFTFHAVVKAHLVSQLIRQSLSAGTDISSGGAGNGGTPGGNASGTRQDISADGAFTVFQSTANNLDSTHSGATGGNYIYLRDNSANTTRMISLINGTTVPTGCASTFPSISNDGSAVAFLSTCQLLASDTNALADVYMWSGGSLTFASVDSGGTAANLASSSPSISPDGFSVAFLNASTTMVDQNGATCPTMRAHVWVFGPNSVNGATTSDRVDMDGSGSCGDQNSFTPSLNNDATLVSFDSNATNLVAGDTNLRGDVFLAGNDQHNVIGVIQMVSLNESGGQLTQSSFNSAISSSSTPSAATIAFQTAAQNFVTMSNPGGQQVYVVRDVSSAASIVRASRDSTGTTLNVTSSNPSLDIGGRFVAFVSAGKLDPGDGNGTSDVYVLDLSTTDSGFATPRIVSRGETGTQAGAVDPVVAISDNSNYVVFSGPDLVAGGVNKQVMRAPCF